MSEVPQAALRVGWMHTALVAGLLDGDAPLRQGEGLGAGAASRAQRVQSRHSVMTVRPYDPYEALEAIERIVKDGLGLHFGHGAHCRYDGTPCVRCKVISIVEPALAHRPVDESSTDASPST